MSEARARWKERARRAVPAAIAGGLAFLAAQSLGLITAIGVQRLLDLEESWLVLLAMIASAGLALTQRARAVPWALGGLLLALYLTVAFTPLASPLVRRWLLREEPRHADAIVVLSSDVTDDGHLSANGLSRLVAGLELARDGHAPLLIRTDISPPRPDDTADAREVAAGVDVEIVLVGPVASTRDEAVAVRELARHRRIESVIVVTSPMHERRAAAAFRNVGLDVVACPSPERMFSVPSLTTPGDRLQAFHQWVTELAAWSLYSLRGWV